MTKIIYAKYPGKCKVCGNKTERNEEVVWAPCLLYTSDAADE